uniref:Coiled-coil domain-containing protein n=1 Tax=Schistosoma mansoni TaxID=6183 RepID=A0A5K4EWS5_SCHMA
MVETGRKIHFQTDSPSDLRQLDYQSKKLYKDSIQLLSKLSLHHKDIKSILEYSQDLKSTLLTDGKKYYNKLFKFRTLVESFSLKKSQIANKQINHGNFVKELQDLLKSIEDILTEYKTEERMIAEALLQQEVELWQDCLNMEHRISFWENDSKISDRMNSKLQNREQSTNLLTHFSSANKTLPNEINEFQNFLDNHGGRTGGWTEDEHFKFLKHYKIQKFKYRNELKNPEKLINDLQNPENEDLNNHHYQEIELNTSTRDNDDQQTVEDESADKTNEGIVNSNIHAFHHELANIIMTKTPEQVAEHVKWWKEFQRLENAKRNAIKKWSENRRLNMQNKKQSEEKNDDHNDTIRTPIKQHLSISQLEARKAELELWRNQREKMKKQAELLKKQAEIQSKQTELELKRKRQAKIQHKISLYKQEKMAEKLTALHQLKIQTKMEQQIRQQKINDAANNYSTESIIFT